MMASECEQRHGSAANGRVRTLGSGRTGCKRCVRTSSTALNAKVAELLLGVPLFPGESGVDQLVEIIKVLGTPSLDEIQQMNQNYSEYKFPQVSSASTPSPSCTPSPPSPLTAHHSPSHHHHSPHHSPLTTLPQVKPHPWSKVFRPRTPNDAIDLVAKFLKCAACFAK